MKKINLFISSAIVIAFFSIQNTYGADDTWGDGSKKDGSVDRPKSTRETDRGVTTNPLPSSSGFSSVRPSVMPHPVSTRETDRGVTTNPLPSSSGFSSVRPSVMPRPVSTRETNRGLTTNPLPSSSVQPYIYFPDQDPVEGRRGGGFAHDLSDED